MKSPSILVLLGLLTLVPLLPAAETSVKPDRPNLVFVLADDLGYGDVRCFNPAGKIRTPHLDRLASQGMRFTDLHSSSSVCSPTRYSLMTGRYNWRSRLQSGVLGGLSPRLIEEGRLTVAELLRQQGYHTAVIGKWHLGMDWARQPGRNVNALGIETTDQNRNVDYTQPIKNGPNAVGFDYYFGISASLDMVPYSFIENDRLTQPVTVDKSFPMTLGLEGKRTRRGPSAPEFEAGQVLPTLTRRALDYIASQAADARSGTPFFLYLPLNAPHTPILPTPEWQGRSGISPYADFVMQTDACIGEVLDALDHHGLTSNTLVICTSDNGCSPEANFAQLAAAGHRPSAHLRGAKADLFEGGHRVPFIAYWPGRVAAGSTNAALHSLVDFMATCADLLEVKLPPNAGEDSVSFLPTLLGQAGASGRDTLVHHSINGSFAIREGKWKLELCPDSGGWSDPKPGSPAARELPPVQLYDLSVDPGETNNLQARHPEVVSRLTAILEQQVSSGRSTPGPAQTNTVQVRLKKSAAPKANPNRRPNIVFCFADDWGRYAGAYTALEDRPSVNQVLRTPNLDRIASQGVLFKNAFVTAPSCTPCRSSLLSGQYFWRTGRGAILQGAQWDPAIPSYPLLLRDAGYHIGKSHKVWSPGKPADAPYGGQQYAYEKAGRNFNNFSENVSKLVREGLTFTQAKAKLLDEVRANFEAFLEKRAPDQPFCYWFGPTLTHRAYEKGSGRALWGINPDSLQGKLPKFIPDVPEVREDFTDYLGEIQAWDAGVGVILEKLEAMGELDRTLLVVSGDHGMPGVPGGKCNLYDFGTAVALLARGPGIKGGRVVDDFVNLMDLAPTFLEAGGVKPPAVMTGRSFWKVLQSDKSGLVDAQRTWVVTGRERHVAEARDGRLPYPHRALRTPDFLYVRNFAPDRWPMGAPKFSGQESLPAPTAVEKNTFVAFADMDASPTKALLVSQYGQPEWAWHYQFAFGKRPAEELFDLRSDPDQTRNVASEPAYAGRKRELADQLMKILRDTVDPRVTGDGQTFDRPPFTDPNP